LNDSVDFTVMSQRFFAESPITGDRAALSGDEARHLSAVMRAKLGDQVVLFDGSGAEFTARITALRKRTVDLAIIERREISRELPVSLTLAVALPKGDRQKWLVEKATELGVTRVVPLITERGVAQPTDSALDRLRRAVIEASKQCGRNLLLQIATPANAPDYFSTAPTDAFRLLADPSGQSVASINVANNSLIHAAIGPEGGFTPAELFSATAAGWQPISLGSRILRVETAAVSVAAWAAIKTTR
jgi:16S rRNA (uracil1498-N3)-methyltransferase